MRLRLLPALFLLTGLFLGACPALAQEVPRYRNLVMEGGGVRGIAYGGALQELQAQGILPHIERVGGTSAGAIQAALLAVGYAPDAIVEVSITRPCNGLMTAGLYSWGAARGC